MTGVAGVAGVEAHAVMGSVVQTVDDGRRGVIEWKVPVERQEEFGIGGVGLSDYLQQGEDICPNEDIDCVRKTDSSNGFDYIEIIYPEKSPIRVYLVGDYTQGKNMPIDEFVDMVDDCYAGPRYGVQEDDCETFNLQYGSDGAITTQITPDATSTAIVSDNVLEPQVLTFAPTATPTPLPAEVGSGGEESGGEQDGAKFDAWYAGTSETTKNILSVVGGLIVVVIGGIFTVVILKLRQATKELFTSDPPKTEPKKEKITSGSGMVRYGPIGAPDEWMPADWVYATKVAQEKTAETKWQKDLAAERTDSAESRLWHAVDNFFEDAERKRSAINGAEYGKHIHVDYRDLPAEERLRIFLDATRKQVGDVIGSPIPRSDTPLTRLLDFANGLVENNAREGLSKIFNDRTKGSSGRGASDEVIEAEYSDVVVDD